jgi:DMSO/TMAO reductase YedYZ molybdopterin-dependent catalytic subunit
MDKKFAAHIVREFEPVNLEFPFSTLDSVITPTDSFYVRNHFPEPKIDVNSWRLKIEGAVEQPFEVSYAELLSLPSQTASAVMECAGNNRVFLVPRVEGAQWELGAVGNAEWTGVPLSVLLDRAGMSPHAVDIIFEGSDKGVPAQPPKPEDPIHFARSLPLAKARRPEVLIVYKMNGEPLTASHGFPVRLVVPGWYGMASVKWLQRIIVSEFSYDGYFQKIDYAFWKERDGSPVRVPISEIELKAQIARPSIREIVPAKTNYLIHGAAWAGEREIVKVEISVDGGQSWQDATLLGDAAPYSWVLWNFDWLTPEAAGHCVVMSRATDSSGRQQPMERGPGRDTYRITHVLPVPVEIR